MNQTLLVIWNDLWHYQIESFKSNCVIYDIIDIWKDFNQSDFINNGRNRFVYPGPRWFEQSIDDKKNIASLYKNILSNNKYDYIFPTWMDVDVEPWADANELLNLKGIRPSAAQYLKSKNDYGKILKELKISTPQIYATLLDYQYIENLKFPLICKPTLGTSGEGIKICNNYQELEKFLTDSNNQRYYPYIIQEYIIGTTVCVVGHISNGKTFVDLIYDIETSDPPYCIETGYKFPSIFNFIEESVRNDIETFANHIDLDNTPFMLDLIVDSEGNYYFIDFSARISYSIYQLMYYLGNSDYFYNLANKILNNKDFCIKKEKSYIYRHFMFPTGVVESTQYRKFSDIKELNLPLPNQKIDEFKNDFDVNVTECFAIVVSDNLKKSEQTWKDLKESIKLIYKS